MKNTLLWLSAFFMVLQLHGQTKGSFISMRGGVSIPVGPYQAKDLDKGCFTQPGFTAGVEGAWYFMPWMGVGGQFGVNFHPVDVSTLGWEKVINDPFLQDVTIRSDAYQIMTAALGIFSHLDLTGWLSAHGKILGGVMWAKTPYQLYKPEYFLVGPEYYEITPSRDRNLMVGFGAGMQADLGSCLALRIEGEYLYSNMAFGFSTATGTRYDYRTISYVNTTLALIIKL